MSETKKSTLEFLEVKQYEEAMADEKFKMREEGIKTMKLRTQNGGYSKYVPMRTKGRRVKKLVIRYVRTK